MSSAQLYAFLPFLVIASTLALPASLTKKTFSVQPPAHKVFNNSFKCSNTAYREIFSQMEDVAISRAHKFFLSEVVLVGKVARCQADSSTNASLDCQINIDCYLRGKLTSSEVVVRNLGPNRDERCFDTPSAPLEQGDTVLVFGNVGQDQRSLHPIDGGIAKLTENDEMTSTAYAGLRCSEAPTFTVAKKPMRPKVVQFCRKLPLNECSSIEFEDVAKIWDTLPHYRWNDLQTVLRSDVNISHAADIVAQAYFSKNYKQSVDSQNVDEARPRISSAGLPKSAVLKGADGKIVFESASVQQIRYVLAKLGTIGRIMNMLKHELDV